MSFISISRSNFLLESVYPLITEAVTGGVLWKKVILKILQNPRENTCDDVS